MNYDDKIKLTNAALKAMRISNNLLDAPEDDMAAAEKFSLELEKISLTLKLLLLETRQNK
jgi:hypothetical protein